MAVSNIKAGSVYTGFVKGIVVLLTSLSLVSKTTR